MHAVLNALILYLLIFIFSRRKNIRELLLLTGIIALPLRVDYALVGGFAHTGWSSGLIVRLSDISFVLLFLHMCLTNERRVRIGVENVMPIMVFAMVCCLSAINSTARMLTLYQVLTFAQIALIYYFVLVKSIRSEMDIRRLVSYFSISLLFQSAISILQFFTGFDFDFFSTGEVSSGFLTIGVGAVRRVYGTIRKPNGFGAYISPLLLLNIAVFLGGSDGKKAMLSSTLLGCIALVLSFSRGAWVGFSLSLIVLLFILLRENILRPGRLGKFVMFALVAAPFLQPLIKIRVFDDFMNTAATSRIPLARVSLNMIAAHPLLGVGANTFSNVMREYVGNIIIPYWHLVHNQYLLVFAEIGILGLVSWLWILARFLWLAYRCYRQKESRYIRLIGIGVGVGLMSSMIHMMVDMFNSYLVLANTFVLGSLVTAAYNIVAKGQPQRKTI